MMEYDRTTLVSAFCNLQKHQELKRPRDIAFYLKNSKPILAMEVPMILFIEPDLVDEITQLRERECKSKRFVNLTHIIPWTLEKSPHFEHFDILNKAYTSGGWPSYLDKDKDSPAYEVWTWSKTHLMRESMKINPFHTETFCWVDLGVFYIPQIYSDVLNNQRALYNLLKTIPKDKVTCLGIHGIHTPELLDRVKYYSVWNSRTAGGLFGGGVVALTNFIQLFEKELKWCLDNKCFVTEEPIYSSVRAENKELFNMYYGDYQDILTGYEMYTCNSTMGNGLALLQLQRCYLSENYEELLDIGERIFGSLKLFNEEQRQQIYRFVKVALEKLNHPQMQQKLLDMEFEMMYVNEGSAEITKEWWIMIKMADKCKKSKDYAKFIEYCERAWELRKSADSIIPLATHYLEIGDHASAYKTLEKSIGYVHHHEIDRLLMIVSYYVGEHKVGLDACDRLILTKGYPASHRSQGITNLFWYVKSIPIQSSINVGEMMDIPTIPSTSIKYNPLNPCIIPKRDICIKDKESTDSTAKRGYLLNCRLVNYYQDTVTGAYTIHNAQNIIHTKNVMLDLDEDLKVVKQQELVDRCVTLKRYPCFAVGLEDMRLVWCGDNLLFSATTLEGSPQSSPNIAMGKISLENSDDVCPIEHYVPMKKPIPNRQEKNWIPFVVDHLDDELDLCTIYSFDPFTVLKCDIFTGDIFEICKTSQNVDLSDLRGSSGLVKYDCGYLTITHQITVFNGRRYYFHRFVHFVGESGGYNVKRVTHPFYFFEKDVEFCSGLAYSGDMSEFLISLGLKDREAHIVKVKVDDVKELLFDV